jgi:two-component system sensor histidine kinase KdpD
VGVTALLGTCGEFLVAAAKAGLPRGRRLAGGLVPAVLAAVAGSVLLSFYFIPRGHAGTIAGAGNAAAVGVFIAVAVAVSLLVGTAVRRTRQAARASAADRMRTVLLAAVSHDLRTPLAAAKAAVSGLRSGDIPLTAADREELLATADESLDLLTGLAASLLDVSRLQAGALPVFPRPADLGEIIARSLKNIGPRARAVVVVIPADLPQVMVDPPIMERVIANVTANALRYSPDRSPPLLTASGRGDRVELRVADRGPGVAQADRDRMFAPFERLGEVGTTTGVGLGLTVSRGLTRAMHGTLEPEQTPGGGLTMAISLHVDHAIDLWPVVHRVDHELAGHQGWVKRCELVQRDGQHHDVCLPGLIGCRPRLRPRCQHLGNQLDVRRVARSRDRHPVACTDRDPRDHRADMPRTEHGDPRQPLRQRHSASHEDHRWHQIELIGPAP